MYVKTTSRTNKDGTPVRYLHLAHNQWDPAAGRSVPRVLYSFGREDAVDRAAIRRLVASLSKLLDPADALAATAGSDLVFLESRPFGGAFVLDALWRRLGIDKVITGLDRAPRRGRPRDAAATERVLFGLVANRALAPSSKLAAAEWISNDVHIEDLPEIGEQACYRAMDWLHGAREHLEARIFDKVATVLNLEVDLLFFDTTSTYFELGEPDEPVARDGKGHRLPGGRPPLLEISEVPVGRYRLSTLTMGKGPDVLLLHWEIPDIGGAEFVRRLRSDAACRHSHAPIIMLSGQGEHARVLELYARMIKLRKTMTGWDVRAWSEGNLLFVERSSAGRRRRPPSG